MSRASRLLATLAAATTLAGGVGVANADAYPPRSGCFIENHRVHRGDADPVRCTHLTPSHRGVAYVVQKEVRRVGPKGHKHREVAYVLYTLAHFHLGRFGKATFTLTVPRELHIGIHKVHFRVGQTQTMDWIRVVRG